MQNNIRWALKETISASFNPTIKSIKKAIPWKIIEDALLKKEAELML